MHYTAIILDITLRDFIFIEDTERQIQKEQANIVLHRVTQEYALKHFTDLTPGQRLSWVIRYADLEYGIVNNMINFCCCLRLMSKQIIQFL